MARRTFRVPSNTHPVDTSAGRTLAPGDVIDERDLVLKGDDEAAVAHDQRLVDEVLIDLSDAPAAREPTLKELQTEAATLEVAGRSDMDRDQLKAAIAEARSGGNGA